MVSSFRSWELNSMELINDKRGGDNKIQGRQQFSINFWSSSWFLECIKKIYNFVRPQNMWRHNRDTCECNNCAISSLQDQVRTHQGEIAELRTVNAQLQQQLQAQEIRRNDELAVVLWAVNINTEHIRSICQQLEHSPPHPQR